MAQHVAYLVFGATLCAAFAAVVAHYFRRGRREHVEAAKYRMLDDDEK
jgi:cbb3-type cytochrome oxidase subunit 3